MQSGGKQGSAEQRQACRHQLSACISTINALCCTNLVKLSIDSDRGNALGPSIVCRAFVSTQSKLGVLDRVGPNRPVQSRGQQASAQTTRQGPPHRHSLSRLRRSSRQQALKPSLPSKPAECSSSRSTRVLLTVKPCPCHPMCLPTFHSIR